MNTPPAIRRNIPPPPPRPGIIRTGQKKPYHKGTKAKIDQRVGFVARLLNAGATKTEIHRAVRQRFNIEWRQCDRYISWLTRTRTEHQQKWHSDLAARIALIYGDKGM